MKLNKTGILLLMGTIASGTGAAYFTESYINKQLDSEKTRLQEQYKSGRIVVAKYNLLIGDILSNENLAIREMPIGFLHKSVITESEADGILGKRIMQPLNAGEPLLTTFLASQNAGNFSYLIEKGHRALTFPVDINSSMSGLLRPGDKIDLVLTINQNNKDITIPLLRNILILATGNTVDNINQEHMNGNFQTITLSVKPVEAAKITHARETGRLTVLLRSGNDKKEMVAELQGPVTINTLTGHAEKTYKKYKKIEIIIGN